MIKLMQGDCLERMKELPNGSVDMVFTSPPYADRRKSTYGGVKADDYVDWFIPIGQQIHRVLSDTGSFFLNIKPHTDKGERSLYVFDLICQLKRELGFLFVDELCWTKNGFPGSLKGRFKNAFEPIYHLTKGSPNKITFNPVACGTEMKEESIARTYRKQCGKPKNGSGMAGMNTTNIRNLEFARPSNVIHVNNVSNQFSDKQLHPATFPEGLVEFFIKSYTNEGDTILDPFTGSGTTGIVSVRGFRRFIGIELDETYFQIAKQRIENAIPDFL
jgi:site-specific DNA-methyltransferase (adenine-specific)